MRRNVHALVVLSGGQDSITCLGSAIKAFGTVTAVHFQYKQKHASPEVRACNTVCNKYSVPLRIVDIGGVLASLVSSALTNSGSVLEVGLPHPTKPGLPSSFVPGRNALFLTLAHAMAQEIGAKIIVTGVCQTDYSGYPDCREEFVTLLEDALNTGYESDIAIITPLMRLNKAETFALAEEVGVLEDVLLLSHTCYNGEHDHFNAWGYGCGKCPACELRKKGYEEYVSRRPYRTTFNLLS